MKSEHPFLIIGHRGARGLEPENTLRGIRRALELGVGAIEIDVQLVEGELVVIHDATLNRTTNGRGRVARKKFAALRLLDAGQGEKIPTLAEVFDTVNRRALINVELKGRKTAKPVAALIEQYVARHGWQYEDFVVSSFRRPELKALAGGSIPLAVLFARRARGFARLAAGLGAMAINPSLRFVTEKLVKKAHASGLKVYVYTVNAREEIERLKAWGVDGVFTDYPPAGK
ncbi:MAG: glycerophosphodiester phosphodiesterase family protein [Chthoniobacteraceae bacterium]